MFRTVFVGSLLVGMGCGSDGGGDPYAPQTFVFGPYTVQPSEEILDQCVSVTLDNDEPLYVNSVELTAGTGFHHSNWFWVPDNLYKCNPELENCAGDSDPGDGAWNCNDRFYSEGAAGFRGGVVFAQSTQSEHELQDFPAGAGVKIPAHSRLVAGTHLLNPSDVVVAPKLELTLTLVPPEQLTTELHGLGFENQSIAIPPNARSRFTVECDLTDGGINPLSGQRVVRPPPDFKIYHALAHYHALGVGETFEAVRDSDGGSEMMFETATHIGDALGGKLDPPFDLTGHSKIRFSCEFENPRAQTVGWGVGDQEMCIIFAFTDSPNAWTGGVPTVDPPGPGVNNNGVIEFNHSCMTITVDNTH